MEYAKILAQFGEHYRQVIILSFPLFFRNLIEGLDARHMSARIKYFGSGEFISEAWRDYVRQRVQGGPEELNDILTLYSAAELGGGLIGFETIFTNLVRSLAKKDKDLAAELFGQLELPVMVQYSPMGYFLEIEDDAILVTCRSGIPLIRYRIKDKGKLLSFHEVTKTLAGHGYQYRELLKELNLAPNRIQRLPLLMVYGRADDTVIFNGVNIYYPCLEPVLHQDGICDVINDYLTSVDFDERQKERLNVHFEAKHGTDVSNEKRSELEGRLAALVLDRLLKTNLDYADEFKLNPTDTTPKVTLHSHGSGPFLKKKLKRATVAHPG